MKCVACDSFLTDRQASRKYLNWREMPEGEGRYIMLCDRCIVDTDLIYSENSSANNEETTDDEDSGEATVYASQVD